MSSDNPIGAPFTLASLSKPVSSTNGRVHAAAVCSVSGIKKRKRTEIAVGIDGEGVSIYSLQNPQLVASYALPPSATLNTAPYSIYRKSASKTPAHRFTYVSLAGSSPAGKAQLVCFHDKTQGEHTETIKTSYTPSSSAPITTLESLPVAPGGSAAEPTHDVIATFDNGDVVCLSADLGVVRWVANVMPLLTPGDVEVEHVSLASAKAVTRGLLRSRQDIVTILDPRPDETSNLLELVQFLCVIGRKSDGERTLSLVQIQPRSADLATTPLSPMKHLLTLHLPSPAKVANLHTTSTQIALHASSGALHLLVEHALLSYDLSGTVPKLQSELILPGSTVDAFLRTSQDVLFTTSQTTCRVFDVKYNSLQALLSMSLESSTTDSASPPKKRKHAQPESTDDATPCSLIAYYADIGLIVAARGDELFGMQFGGAVPRKRVKTEGTLLIDALGKGLASTLKTSAGLDSKRWQERKMKLDKYVSKGKIAKFEQAFAMDLGIELESADIAQKHKNEVNGGPLTNGGGPSLPDEDAKVIDKLDEEPPQDELQKWKMPKIVPNHQRQQYRQYALYALSKIFYCTETGPQDEPQCSLKVGFFPPNVFKWLLQIGHLTKESIHRSMLDARSDPAQLVSTIVDGDIVKALVELDPDLHILSAVLNHNHFLPIGEVVQAIKLLIQSIDDQPRQHDATKLLTNGTASAEDEMDLDFASELEAASNEIDHALSVLDHGVLTRSHTLRPALIRLHTFPGSSISSTLRSILPRRDLESLIRLLHLELKNGGWSSPLGFVDTEPSVHEDAEEDPDDHAVAIIASLLSSTLDAIGAGAWLASVGPLSSSVDTSEDMLKGLNEDASIALSGFFEAHFIRGLLSEFLRYASTVPASRKPSNKDLEMQRKPFGVTGKLSSEEDLPILPLGARADMGIEKTKSGKGGKKEQRSKREIGMLISKRVPKYSFERIVI